MRHRTNCDPTLNGATTWPVRRSSFAGVYLAIRAEIDEKTVQDRGCAYRNPNGRLTIRQSRAAQPPRDAQSAMAWIKANRQKYFRADSLAQVEAWLARVRQYGNRLYSAHRGCAGNC